MTTSAPVFLSRGSGVLRFPVALLVLVNYASGAMGPCSDQPCFDDASVMAPRSLAGIWSPLGGVQAAWRGVQNHVFKIFGGGSRGRPRPYRPAYRPRPYRPAYRPVPHPPYGPATLAPNRPPQPAYTTSRPSPQIPAFTRPSPQIPAHTTSRLNAQCTRLEVGTLRSSGGMTAQERQAVQKCGHTDDIDNRNRHSNSAYYKSVEKPQDCYPEQDRRHKVKALVLIDEKFCDRATHPFGCEAEAREIMEKVSEIFVGALNVRIEVASVEIMKPDRNRFPAGNFGCRYEDKASTSAEADARCKLRMKENGVSYGLCPFLSGCDAGWRSAGSMSGGDAFTGGLCSWSGGRVTMSSRHVMPIFYSTVHELGHLFGANHASGDRFSKGFMEGGSNGYVMMNNKYYYGFNRQSENEMCSTLRKLKNRGGRDEEGMQCLFLD